MWNLDTSKRTAWKLNENDAYVEKKFRTAAVAKKFVQEENEKLADKAKEEN